MNDVLKIFLSLSLSGSLMILILFLCKHFWKDKISRQWQYYIWLIVVARLLLPFAPETNLMGSIFQTIDYTMIQTNTIQVQQEEQNYLQDIENTLIPNIKQNEQKESKQQIQMFSSQSIQNSITWLINNIWLIWLGMALILLIRKITIYQSFVHYVKAGQSLVSDIELLDQLSVLAGQVGIKKPIEFCINPLISSPLLIGFFHPYIVLPSIKLSEKEFQYTILHELTHFRRRDMFYKWLVQITLCLHWFNPFVYFMSREINIACEFSCDEAIIAKLDFSNTQEYGKTLLNAMVKAGHYKQSLASITLNENKELLKERLGAIMSFKKKSRIVVAITFILTTILICGASYTGVYAAKNSSASSTNNNQYKQSTKDYSQISNKPGTKLRMIDIWSGLADETTRQDGIVEVNMTNFTGSRTNYEFESEQDGSVTLRFKSSLSGNYEILFTEKGDSTILETIPAFTGSKEIVLTELPKGTINLTVYAMNTSGKLEIEKIAVQNSIAKTDSPNISISKTSQPKIDGTKYNYFQRGYYQGNYIFDLGWNLDEKSSKAYPNKAKLTLPDFTAITVSFDKSCKAYVQDQAVLTDLTELIEKLKSQYSDSAIPLERPLVSGVEYVGNKELIKLAEEYYTNGKLTKFSAIFSLLDRKVQKEYCSKMIEDGKLSFFSSCAAYIDTDTIKYCTKKSYEEEKLTFFSCIAPYLTHKQKQKWAARASKDNKNTFLSVLTKETPKSWTW